MSLKLNKFMNTVEIEQTASKIAQAPFDASVYPYQIMAAFRPKSSLL